MSGRYIRSQSLFVSSNDQPVVNGRKLHYDFYVDLNPAVSQLQAEFGQARDPDIRITASVAHLWVPFESGSRGFVQRRPPMVEYDQRRRTYYTPQVRMLRLHTNLLHGNASSRGGYNTTALQIPFMPNYHEATDDSYAHAFVSYERGADPETAGTFELTNGLDNMNMARFWITDERDHTLRTKSNVPVHIGLILRVETAVRKRKRNDDMYALMRELVGMQRLQVIQNERNSRERSMAVRGLIDMQHEFERTNDASDIIDIEGGEEEEDRYYYGSSKTYRDFVREYRKRREGPFYLDTRADGVEDPPQQEREENEADIIDGPA